MSRTRGKHDQKYVGPYKIQSISEHGTYTLIDNEGQVLRRARAHLRATPDPTSDSYSVERILKHRGKGNSLQYLVKWENFPHSENEWLYPEDFDDTKIITLYWQKIAQRKRKREPDTGDTPKTKKRRTTKADITTSNSSNKMAEPNQSTRTRTSRRPKRLRDYAI